MYSTQQLWFLLDIYTTWSKVHILPRQLYIDNLHIYTQIIPTDYGTRLFVSTLKGTTMLYMLVAVPLLHMTERTLCFQCWRHSCLRCASETHSSLHSSWHPGSSVAAPLGQSDAWQHVYMENVHTLRGVGWSVCVCVSHQFRKYCISTSRSLYPVSSMNPLCL